jgi:hypothetical protein
MTVCSYNKSSQLHIFARGLCIKLKRIHLSHHGHRSSQKGAIDASLYGIAPIACANWNHEHGCNKLTGDIIT